MGNRTSRSNLTVACLILITVACAGNTSTDAGPPVMDAGTEDAGPVTGDAGPITVDAGQADGGQSDAGLDAGLDAGTDAGLDAGTDAGLDAGTDAGLDAGTDAGLGAGTDAGLDAGTDAGLDAGPTAIDAGTDAGLDAGQADAGSDAGQADSGPPPVWDGGLPDGGSELDGGPGESVTLSIAANPNSVLSAIATVSWTGPLTSVQIEYFTPDGGAPQTTPVTSISGTTGPVTLPVLGLKARTDYTLLASATDVDGNRLTSPTVSLTTGALPSGVITYTVADGGMGTPGYTLIARLPEGGNALDYMTIADTTGAPVWYLGVNPGLGGDFQLQPDGTVTVAVDDPSDQIAGLDETCTIYEQFDMLGNKIHTWTALDVPTATPPVTIAATDDHELRIEPNGDALLFGYMEQPMDLSAQGGLSDAEVVAAVLERITTAGEVVFSWNSFSYLSTTNIDPAATPISSPVVDFTHANAIDVMDDGNYLLSMRNMSQVLKINSTTGDIMWKLGGKDSNFTFENDPLHGFSCQHGARELPNGDIIMLDDGDGHSPPQSRAVEYTLDMTTMTATLSWSSEDDPALYTFILGYADRLSNGNTLITYGTTLHVQEVDSTGEHVLWDLFDQTHGYGLYRAYHLDSLYPQ